MREGYRDESARGCETARKALGGTRDGTRSGRDGALHGGTDRMGRDEMVKGWERCGKEREWVSVGG